MTNVTVPKSEFESLKKQAAAYRKLTATIFELAIKDPVDQIVSDFRKTTLYTDEFLRDLENGLRRSSYIKHAHKTSTRRP